ncbi:hypothetical protein Pla144_10930 [Bythopirellula polymerisocia]|uniref:Uncharacterized protein n=1 Tax=Bythopirellula polymerisocia TaxID=2528003 RepID=A0A5C6D3S1_9BACT|nr:hypothetical protein Pla144_10930 [Bythopirellula polymerisocia]
MDIAKYNQFAWDQQVRKGNRWTVPVSEETIAAARARLWQVVLTPQKPMPKSWFPPMDCLEVLCLASGGRSAGAHPLSRGCPGHSA